MRRSIVTFQTASYQRSRRPKQALSDDRGTPGHVGEVCPDLLHEAYLRLVDVEQPQQWDGRGHFFAAAAEAMRRILIDRARRNKRLRHGSGRARLDLQRLDETQLCADETAEPAEELLALDEALTSLCAQEPQAGELVKLRYFAGLTIEQAAETQGISARTANRHWAYARAWLFQELSEGDAGLSPG